MKDQIHFNEQEIEELKH